MSSAAGYHGDEDVVHPDIDYVHADELAAKLKGPSAQEVIVIDVREESDFVSGHIHGAANCPSSSMKDPEFAQKVFESHLDRKAFVVHCGMSKHRGPTCARVLKTALEKYVAEKGDSAGQLPEIKVLSGGYLGFEEKYAAEADLFDKQA